MHARFERCCRVVLAEVEAAACEDRLDGAREVGRVPVGGSRGEGARDGLILGVGSEGFLRLASEALRARASRSAPVLGAVQLGWLTFLSSRSPTLASTFISATSVA